jgi:chitinase
MEQYVDMFDFMAYDLNWGRTAVHGQTDIRDIEQQASALWASGISLSKVNLGLAYYGRGFTLQNRTGTHEGCPAVGSIKNGPCTQSGAESVLSLTEIKDIVAKRKLSPSLVKPGMYKQIVWDGQWMGYDDEDTFSMKRAWASGKCLGGTMIWSMDLYNHGKV